MNAVHGEMRSSMPATKGKHARDYIMGGAPCEEVPVVVRIMQKMLDALQTRWPAGRQVAVDSSMGGEMLQRAGGRKRPCLAGNSSDSGEDASTNSAASS